MNKKELGLTNNDLACIIDNLSDDDFLEVMEIIGKAHNIHATHVGGWLNTVVEEIQNK